ncbi:hypothetical protein BGX31_001374, partial [Mortierella sp. GBA43]
MIVTKPGDESLLKITREISLWMIRSRRLTVYVDEKLRDVPKFRYPAFLKSTKRGYDCTEGLKFWTSDLCEQEAHLFDFAITKIVPPILPFSAGSLGFLTPFPTTDYQEILSTCLDRGVRVNLRMRFSCTIYRCLEHRTVDTTKKKKRRGHRYRDKTRSPSEQVDESDEDSDTRSGMALPTVLTTPTETFEVLNDLVLDRGPSASLSLLELFGDEEHLTTVQADGIVISTPTGSTAYSLAAGGPLTHPEIPSILISPICPHTLSFRPMLLPDSMELRICVPFDSRSTAWASFDGRGRVELKRGDHIKVTASLYPFPTICSSTQSSDWFHSLSRCLRWNERGRQKAFNIVEHDRPKKTRQTSSATMSPPGPGAGKHNAGSGDNVQLPPSVAMGVKGVSDIPQGRRSRDHSPGPSTSGSGPGLGHGYNPARSSSNLHFSHSYGHVSGHGGHHGAAAAASSSSSGSIGQTRPRHGSVRSTTGSGGAGSGTNQDYFNQSPPNADTMLTCWGTDSCTSSEDSDKTCDDSDSDSLEDKEAAADGDGEWEEDGSSTEESDDDEYCEHVAARGKSTCSQPSCERSGSGGTAAAAAATRTRTALSGTAGTGPTVVPHQLQERYAKTFYGSGDLQPECLQTYNECVARLGRLLSFEPEQARGGSIAIMSGEGMVALWGGFKSVIPWPFEYDSNETLVLTQGNKYKILCIGNGVYGDGMLDMVKSLRYPNVEVRAVKSAWDRPVDVKKAVETIQDWKPDLVT